MSQIAVATVFGVLPIVSLYLGVFYHRTYNAEVHFWTNPRCQALAMISEICSERAG